MQSGTELGRFGRHWLTRRWYWLHWRMFWCCAAMGAATLALCRFASSWSHTSPRVTGLQPFTLVSVHSHHARHWSHHRISGVDCTAPQGPTNCRYSPVRPRAAGPSVSCASPPTRPAPSRCLRGRPSSVLRPDQTLPLSPNKPPAAPHVFPCPRSFGPLRPLTRQNRSPRPLRCRSCAGRGSSICDRSFLLRGGCP